MKFLGTIFAVGYFAIGVVQIAATMQGLEEWLGWPGWICSVLGLFIGWTPVIGTALGIYGAVAGWDWPVVWAIVLFAGFPIFFLILNGISKGLAAVAERR